MTALFRGRADFDGVLFDGFSARSVLVAPEARRAWQHVYFGDRNLAKHEELFRDLSP